MKNKTIYLALLLIMVIGCKPTNEPIVDDATEVSTKDLMLLDSLFLLPCECLHNADSGKVYVISSEDQLDQINPNKLPIHINFNKFCLVYIKFDRDSLHGWDNALLGEYRQSETTVEISLDYYNSSYLRYCSEEFFAWQIYPKTIADKVISVSLTYHSCEDNWGLFGIMQPYTELEWLLNLKKMHGTSYFDEAILRDLDTYEIVYAYNEFAPCDKHYFNDHSIYYDKDGNIFYQFEILLDTNLVVVNDSLVKCKYKLLAYDRIKGYKSGRTD